MKPKFSIIIPTKNRGYCIWKSILSLQNQTFRNWELIVVDGNSVDDTKKVVSEFADDERVRFVLNEKDTGVASARNRGIDESKGEYIAYLDSDDFVYDNWLDEINNVIVETGKKVIMPNKRFVMKLVDENNKTEKVFIDKDLFDGELTVKAIVNLEVPSDTNGLVHLKSIINKVGYWDTGLMLYEDYEFLLRIFSHYPDELYFLDKRLVEYTRTYGKDGLCGKAKYKDLVDCLEKVYQMHGGSRILREITWYPATIDKYKKYSVEEDLNGRTILDKLLEKYSDG